MASRRTQNEGELTMKTTIICEAVVKSVAFICITLATIYFKDTSLLWWYLAPLLI